MSLYKVCAVVLAVSLAAASPSCHTVAGQVQAAEQQKENLAASEAVLRGLDTEGSARKQLLESYYKEAGLSMADAKDGSNCSVTYTDENHNVGQLTAYPGQYEPVEYFGEDSTWSVILPEAIDISTVKVSIRNVNTNDSWKEGTDRIDLWLSSDKKCLMFLPYDMDYRVDNTYRVEITGIETPICYELRFIDSGKSVPLESIGIKYASSYLIEGDSNYRCSVEYTPNNATNRNIIWSSSDADIAEPVWDGIGVCKILAKKTGTVFFTATSEDGGHTEQIEINVVPKAKSIELNETDVTIGLGQSFTLTGKILPNESYDFVRYGNDYDEKVVSVEDAGSLDTIRVTGKSLGQTAITVRADHDPDISATCRIKVVKPVYTESLTLDKTEIEMTHDEVVQLNLSVYPDNITCNKIEWSSDSTFVEVEDGKVTARAGYGTAVVTAKAMDGSGKEAKCTIEVYGKFDKPSPPKYIFKDFDTVRLGYEEIYEYSMDKIHWQDSNVFTGLESGHTYTFYRRRKAESIFRASDVSEGTVVTLPTWPESLGTYEPWQPTQNPGATQSAKPTESPKPTQGQSSVKTGSVVTTGVYWYRIESGSTAALIGVFKKNMTKVHIHDTVKLSGKRYKITSVQGKVFKDCKKLSKITLGKNITVIGDSAFMNCKKLKNIVIESTKLKKVGKNALKGISYNAKIKVPVGKLKAYKKLLRGKGQGSKVKIIK